MIEDLMKAPLRVIESTTFDDLPIAVYNRLQRRAAEIGHRFRNVFLHFADVHQAINHSNPLSDLDIERTGTFVYVCAQ